MADPNRARLERAVDAFERLDVELVVLESDNSGREFWEQSRPELLASVSSDATWVGLDAKTHAAGEALLAAGRELQKALKAFRKRVCTEHDIPFAPPSYR